MGQERLTQRMAAEMWFGVQSVFGVRLLRLMKGGGPQLFV